MYKMAEDVERKTSSIHSEDDLQRMIDSEAWCDIDSDKGNSRFTGPVEADSDSGSDQDYYNRKINLQLLWSVDEQEDDPEFSSGNKRQILNHDEIVKELIAKLAEAEGEEETEEHGFSPLDNTIHIKASGDSEVQQKGAESRHSRHIVADCGDDNDQQHLEMGTRPLLEGALPYEDADNEPTLSTKIVADRDSPLPEKPKYYHIAHEILTTERTYVRDLHILEKVIHGAVKTMYASGTSVLSESEMKEIFLNIGEIYALNFDLKSELEERFNGWDCDTQIAKTLAKRARFLKLYSTYAKGFDKATKVYTQKLTRSKQFRKLIEMIESHPFCNGNKVPSFMILPVQRVPRYKLLLQDYLKHLPKDHLDVENAEAALTVISEAASHMNSVIADLECQSIMLKVGQCFVGRDLLMAPGRKFIGRGRVTFVPQDRKEERVLFLFSDILLVASSSTHKPGQYHIHQKLCLKDLLINSLEDNPAVKNAFCIAIQGTQKLYRFSTESEKDRDTWIKKLKRGREANKEYFALNKTCKHAAILDDSVAYQSIMSVLNDPSFEHALPSWLRRPQKQSYSANEQSTSVAPPESSKPLSITSPHVHASPPVVDCVDYLPMEGVQHDTEEIKMEFEQEMRGERALLTMSLNPGIDNSLSSYMYQRSTKENDWKRRWFVLTNQTILCYKDHMCDEVMGIIPLAGYKLSFPILADKVKKTNVLKLNHPKNPGYFFQLPSTYDFEKWSAILKELLQSAANSYY